MPSGLRKKATSPKKRDKFDKFSYTKYYVLDDRQAPRNGKGRRANQKEPR